ncbi:MAG: hypothetical protein ACI9YM_001177 [Brevundimonas sp.]|jgi:hypothetical protein
MESVGSEVTVAFRDCPAFPTESRLNQETRQGSRFPKPGRGWVLVKRTLHSDANKLTENTFYPVVPGRS